MAKVRKMGRGSDWTVDLDPHNAGKHMQENWRDWRDHFGSHVQICRWCRFRDARHTLP